MHKSRAFYDCIAKIPCIWRRPGRIQAGERRAEFVEGVDLMPTALELCGLEIPDGVQGFSHAPGLLGREPFRRKAACFAEVGHEGTALTMRDLQSWNLPESAFRSSTRDWVLFPGVYAGKGKMVRTERWKLSYYEEGVGELYDMIDDPWELKNLYNSPDHEAIVNELKAMLLDWTIETENTLPSLPPDVKI